MKYTICGLDQEVLVQLGCDCVDAAFLDWFSDWVLSGNMLTADYEGRRYYWLRYKHILTELPILAVKQQALVKRIDDLVSRNVLLKYVERNREGTKTYFSIVPETWKRLKSRSDEATHTKIEVPTHTEVGVRTHTEIPPKDSPIMSDSLFSDSIPTATDSKTMSHRSYGNQFEEFWSAYPRHVDKAGAYKCFVARIREGVSIDDMMTAARNYAERCAGKPTEYVMHGSTFLNAGHRFEDYVRLEEPKVIGGTGREETDADWDRQLKEHLASRGNG